MSQAWLIIELSNIINGTENQMLTKPKFSAKAQPEAFEGANEAV